MLVLNWPGNMVTWEIRLDAYLLDGLITPNNFPDSIVVVKVSTAFIKLSIIYKKSSTPSLCLVLFKVSKEEV